MYSTCIFCRHALRANEVIEHFPVGRRLAFDSAKGRLWVVCRRCERWNLSPLEERWEAIEECERLFRGRRLRAQTDHIGLARLPEGLDLVRVGAPLRPEFAAWRYGDQFGRRRLKHLIYAGLGLAAIGTVVAGASALGATAAVTGLVFNLARNATVGDPDAIVARIPRPDSVFLAVRRRDLDNASLHFESDGRWGLWIQDRDVGAHFLGVDAARATATLLAAANRSGASGRGVRAALAVLESVPEPAAGRMAAIATRARRHEARKHDAPVRLGQLGPAERLALEMALHEESEQRAIEGELSPLAQAWREAEEVAAIADALLLPSSVETRLAQMRGGNGRR